MSGERGGVRICVGFRWMALVSALVLQVCLGATYAWAEFIEPLKAATAIHQAGAQVPFSLFYAIFPLAITIQGFCPIRAPLHRIAVTGGILFGLSWILAGLGIADARWITLCVGVFGGVGVGLVYLIPVHVAMAWFPRHKGLVTGVALAGFGGGAAIVGALADRMFSSWNWTIFQALQTFGLAFAVLTGIAGFAMRPPHEGTGRADAIDPSPAPSPTVRGLIGDRVFRALFLTMSAGLMTGLTIAANLKHMQGSGVSRGASTVAVFALTNALGRILWGRCSDRFPIHRMLALNLWITAAFLVTAPIFVSGRSALLLFTGLMGLNYGGVLSMHPALIARRWGHAWMRRVYGLIFAAHFPAILAPPIAGRLWESMGTIHPVLCVCAALCALGARDIARALAQNPDSTSTQAPN
ncbi:MAG: MFS transporter [Kiritimatiellae bacterium]|nr:MFS transporter [Kiritimatiellia bacterium]